MLDGEKYFSGTSLYDVPKSSQLSLVQLNDTLYDTPPPSRAVSGVAFVPPGAVTQSNAVSPAVPVSPVSNKSDDSDTSVKSGKPSITKL